MTTMIRLCILVVAVLVGGATAGEDTHTWLFGEQVTLWVNKVGPYHNPQESYKYYSLPFCRPQNLDPGKEHPTDGFAAALEGHDLDDSGVHLQFKKNLKDEALCTMKLNANTATALRHAVSKNYWYQMYIDDLPIFGMIGKPQTDKKKGVDQLYTHKSLSIAFNGNRIIEANLSSGNLVEITDTASMKFTYSVTWTETTVDFDDRFDRYLDFKFFEHQIHWFSIFNSFMMVIFLCGIVALILVRTLKSDYVRYTAMDDDLELDSVIDESGWKQIHGDVYRPPTSLMVYSALLGTGYQLICVTLISISLALVGRHYAGRGHVTQTFLLAYVFSAFVSGARSGSYYKQNGGKNWKLTMFTTAALFPLVNLMIYLTLNFVALGYEVTGTLSFGKFISLMVIFTVFVVPMTVTGTVVGRNMSTKDDFPCRVNTVPRPIPDAPWYRSAPVLALATGLLPFGCIFIEMYFTFYSMWNYKFYYVYGFLLSVFVILVLVTMCVTVVASYVLLNSENWKWQWTMFYAGGSTGLYAFFYSVYFFMSKTQMSGMLQVCYYFGYMLMFSLYMFLLGGAVAHIAASNFIRMIYQYIKSD